MEAAKGTPKFGELVAAFLVAGLLISGSKVRVLDGPPIITGARIRRPQTLPRPLADNDLLERIMALSLEPREQVVRGLLRFTGLRVSGLCALRVSDIAYGAVKIGDREFPGTLRTVGKGGKAQVIPLHPELRELLVNYILSHHGDRRGPSPHVEITPGRPYRRRTIERLMAGRCAPVTALVRHAAVPARDRHSDRPGAPRPRGHQVDDDLYAGGRRAAVRGHPEAAYQDEISPGFCAGLLYLWDRAGLSAL